MQRATVADLTATFDIVVVGGGITGVAIARDAALRGHSVLLLEKDDFAAGTSSRSSKLIHGGLRYLQTYQFRLVAEALRERERMLRIAPHLTEVRPFLYLLYEGYPETRRRLSLGLTFYDLASGKWRERRHALLSPEQVLAREPHLAREGLLGAGLFYDVLTDDARVTLDTAKGASEAGAKLRNHTAVVGLLVEGGKAVGVRARDTLTGESLEVSARQVVNATGPWTDRVQAFEHGRAGRLRPTKGVHIVVRKSDFPLGTAVFLRSPDDNRVVWPTPSLEDDRVYIGTTDTDYVGDPDDVRPEESDIRYLLNVANRTIPGARLTEDHVVGSWAGLRPLVAPSPGVSASSTSREHAITTGPTGMITISGGKLTSSRLMAQQLVDAAEDALRSGRRRSRTSDVPIAGASFSRLPEIRSRASEAGVLGEVADAWVRRYGSDAAKVLEVWQRSAEGREVVGARALTRAEIRYAVEEEMCASLADLMVRRTSAFFWDDSGGLAGIDAVADELASLLAWAPERRDAEIASYRSLVQRHRPRRV